MVEAALSMSSRPASWSLGELWKSRTVRTLLVLLSLWALLAIHPETREAFLTSGNFSNVTAQVAEIVIIGVGMTFIVLTGGIDLSVGAGMALFGVVAAVLQIDKGQPAWVAISAALAISVVVGLWHGLLVTRLKVPPFIATLTGFLAYRGLALLLSGARGLSPMGEDFAMLGGQISVELAYGLSIVTYAMGIGFLVQRERRRRAFGLPAQSNARIAIMCVAITLVLALVLSVYRDGMPVPVLIAALVLGIGGVLLRLTRLGRYAFAIGGNAEAARLSGVPVTKVKVTIYLLTALLTALAGVVSAARTNGVTPGNMGLVRELHVITAVVIGGTSLSGGRATMLGTLLGALIFGTLSNGMNLLNVDSNWQLILTGVILLGASLLDSVSSRTDNP
jgi:D-xylose transport system permease protein